MFYLDCAFKRFLSQSYYTHEGSCIRSVCEAEKEVWKFLNKIIIMTNLQIEIILIELELKIKH